jgi:glycine betaine/choline ABC-type transport system substrate-binding protein|tara:strand:+ start:713 stop:901 length:189 start_codon:yes stop_codon:yes gene_type:complete
MEQKATLNQEEIVSKLIQLESEISDIKEKLNSEEERELNVEMEVWKQASEEDCETFLQKHNL